MASSKETNERNRYVQSSSASDDELKMHHRTSEKYVRDF